MFFQETRSHFKFCNGEKEHLKARNLITKDRSERRNQRKRPTSLPIELIASQFCWPIKKETHFKRSLFDYGSTIFKVDFLSNKPPTFCGSMVHASPKVVSWQVMGWILRTATCSFAAWTIPEIMMSNILDHFSVLLTCEPAVNNN